MDTVDVVSPSDLSTIRDLNDAFRTSFVGGHVNVTSGVIALEKDVVSRILQMVRTYTDFNDGNDPHREHDFGSIEASGQKVFWKLDYYDKMLQAHSPNAADPRVTTRVLTIMLASEY
jgi:hypothetical protein